MSKAQRKVGIGVIGCGGFGCFALEQFQKIPGVELVGMAATHAETAKVATERFGLRDFKEIQALLEAPGLDFVYIATPPFLHYEQAMQALAAGKHVLVEKPMALRLPEADAMIATARERNLMLTTNLMQRHNPLSDAIRALISRKPLGDLLHGYFENYACDEALPAAHWFWDRDKSGGIFVEHGVHFFDLFAGWLGPGRVESAQACRRPGTSIEDQVQCTLRYSSDVLINYYHGFTQPKRMDRQELRLVFERGDVKLEEWVPVRATIHACVDEADLRTLQELFPHSDLDVTASGQGENRHISGRHKPFEFDREVTMHHGQKAEKMERYGALVGAVLADQLAWIEDRRHVRRLTEENGRDSLAVALEADRMAHI